MIIRRSHIDNFGCFHDFDLELQPGLNRFQWKNEGGKSTLLEFIRRIFWGFPDKRSKLNPYPALKGSGLYGGFLDVTLKDGTPLRLERYGVRGKLKIISENGDAETFSDISCYTKISEVFYRNVCAVTLDEVTAFGALDDPEIRHRLYGNALSNGGVSLSEIQDTLVTESENIFKKRGTLHLLKQLSSEFSASEKRLAQAAQAMPAYEKAILSAEKFEAEAQRLREEIDKLQTRILSAEKALNAEKLRRKLAEDETQFAARPLPAPVPEALPPFEEKAPQVPPEPENVTLPPPPERPTAPALEGKCDISRAAHLGERELETWNTLLEKGKKIEKDLRKNLSLTLGICLFAGVSVILIAALYPQDWLLNVWGVQILLTLPLPLIRGYKELLERNKVLKAKQDLFFRFALNPVLEEKELPVLLNELMLFQKRLEEYEEQMKLFEARKKQLDNAFLEYKTRRKLHDEKLRAFEERRKLHEKKRLENEALCRHAAMELARYESEKLSLSKRRKELEQLYPDSHQEKVSEEEILQMKEKLRSLKIQREEKIGFAGAEQREAALLLKGVDSAVEVNVREQLRGKMRSASERYLVLSAARIILERAVERAERERQPELLKKASLYMERFTCGACTRVYNSAKENLLKVATSDFPDGKTPAQLSRGTREQLFLALRLALIDSLWQDDEMLPVVFDDIFVNFDTGRRNAAWQTVGSFAADKQLIIFECK